jgi:hypothetical protein
MPPPERQRRPAGGAARFRMTTADVLDWLEPFARIDPALVARLDERDWPPLPLSEVA